MVINGGCTIRPGHTAGDLQLVRRPRFVYNRTPRVSTRTRTCEKRRSVRGGGGARRSTTERHSHTYSRLTYGRCTAVVTSRPAQQSLNYIFYHGRVRVRKHDIILYTAVQRARSHAHTRRKNTYTSDVRTRANIHTHTSALFFKCV